VIQVGEDTPYRDIVEIADMLMEFRLEYDDPDVLVYDKEKYLDWVISAVDRGIEIYYIKNKGFLVVEPFYDTLKKPEFARSYVLSSIYVRPQFRNTRIYGILAQGILDKYQHNMVGSAMLGTVHDKVLSKRFKKIANVYNVNIMKENLCLQQ